MDKKSLGPFLVVLGFTFLAISGITIWSMFFDFTTDKAVYIVLSIPLLAFSFFTIFYGFYSIFEKRLGTKTKGLILLIDGLIPIIAAIIGITDTRLVDIHHIRLLVLFPLTLVGLFIIVYGVFLMLSEKYLKDTNTRKRYNKILGLVSMIIGIGNIVSYVILIQMIVDFSLVLSFFWVLIGGLLIYFGFHLVVKKIK
jgi:hypothetical protein